MTISELVPRRPHPRCLVLGALSAGVFLLAGCSGDGSPASTESAPPYGILASVVKTPFEGTNVRFEECLGEEIRLDYRQQLVVHESVDAQGRLHFHTNINDKGSTAVGLTSGTTYHQVGTTRENLTIVESLPTVISFVNVLHLIGQGSAPDLYIHESFHLTVNATGVVTVERETQRITCK